MHWSKMFVTSGLQTKNNTQSQGYVMYVRPTSANHLGDSVSFTSPKMYFYENRTSLALTVQFWYKITGTSPLSLSVRLHGNKEAGSPLGFVTGSSTGGNWTKGCIRGTFTGNNDYFYVDVKATSQFNSSNGDIMIDDIVVTKNTRCDGSSSTSGSGHVTNSPMTSLISVSCDFENSEMCGYSNRNLTYDDFDWTRHQGKTKSIHTGPDADHTSGSGYYMYIEASSPSKQGDVAKLQSPPFFADGNQRLTFWYSMYGDSIGSLGVYLTNGNTQQKLFSESTASATPSWKQACVDITTEQANARIEFRGVVGSNYNGDIAIDDVNLDTGNCNNITGNTSEPSKWTEWSHWSTCSTTCGIGTITRGRTCKYVKRSTFCTGNSTEIHECSSGPCPSWSKWYEAACSSTCGNGTRERLRTCSTGTDSDCLGKSTDIVPCIGTECI
ncbi:hypothetical protein ACF0H5_024061 [Mactra antiquata]